MSKRGSRPLVDWASVNWREQDIVIAEKLGVSRERVRQVRNDNIAYVLGVPAKELRAVLSDFLYKTPKILSRMETGEEKDMLEKKLARVARLLPSASRCRRHSAFSLVRKMDTQKLTLRDISKKTGYTVGHVRNVLDELHRGHKREDLRSRGKYKWDSISEEQFYSLTDNDIAKRLGIKNPGVVTLRRIRKHLLKRLNSLGGMTEVEFHALSDADVASRIGVEVETVTQYRRALAKGWVSWAKQDRVVA